MDDSNSSSNENNSQDEENWEGEEIEDYDIRR